MLQATRIGTESQVDTYFVVPKGRLKLRESGRNPSTLIYYEREDTHDSKQSDYHLVSIDGKPARLRNVLTRALGILVQVRKTREVFNYGNTRIHLDVVERLGSFIEFEYVVGGESPVEDGKEVLGRLKQHFGIREEDLVATSYSDLLVEAANRAS
jgi:predicted adenylyl cyclase CyaB